MEKKCKNLLLVFVKVKLGVKNVRLAWTHSTPLNFFLEEKRWRPRKEQRG